MTGPHPLEGVQFGDHGVGFTPAGMLALLDQLPVALAVTRGPDHRFVYANQLYRRIHEPSLGQLEGRKFLEVFGNVLPIHHLRVRDQVFSEQKSQTSSSISILLPERESFWDITLVPLATDKPEERGVLTIAVEVTASVNAQREKDDYTARLQAQAEHLAREQERLSIAVEATDLGIWEWDISNNAVYWSPRQKEIFGLPLDQEISYDVWANSLHPDDRAHVLRAVGALLDQASDGHLRLRHRVVRPDGCVRWIVAGGRMLYSGSDRKPLRLLGTVLDVTDRQLMEDQLREAVKAKDLLVREVHHRVKNSLQIVSAMLLLQERVASTSMSSTALSDASARISTVAKLHDHLHRSSSTVTVELSDYLGSLCKDLERAAGKPGLTVAFEGSAIEVANELAISVALIVNELVTNALKYAYPSSQGVVRVWLSPGPSGTTVLSVEDKGVGLPVASELRDSFGLLMAHTLARQLDSALQQEPVSKGTRFKVAFDAQIPSAGLPEL